MPKNERFWEAKNKNSIRGGEMLMIFQEHKTICKNHNKREKEARKYNI